MATPSLAERLLADLDEAIPPGTPFAALIDRVHVVRQRYIRVMLEQFVAELTLYPERAEELCTLLLDATAEPFSAFPAPRKDLH
jgi:hypothetical protein